MSRTSIAALTTLGERINKSIGKYQSSHAASIIAEQTRLTNAMAGITGMRESPNSLETPAAHTLRLTTAAKKLAEQTAKIREKVFKDYSNYSLQLNEALLERGGVKENQYASEVRAAFKALSPKDRMPFIQEMIEKGDGASFAAILQAPEILTGIPKEMNKTLSDAFYEKVAPDIVQEMKDASEAMDGVVASLKVVEGDLQSYQDPATMKRIEDEVQRSQAASDKFNAALAA